MINTTHRTCGFEASHRCKPLWLFLIVFFLLVGCGHRPETATNLSRVPEPAVSRSDSTNDNQLEPPPAAPEFIKPSSEDDPVEVRFAASKRDVRVGESFDVSVAFSIDPAYEIHSMDASAPQIPTQIELELPVGFTAVEDWDAPAPVRSLNPGGQSVFTGEVEFVQTIQVSNEIEPGDHQLICSVSYQACNSRRCLRPTKSVLTIELTCSAGIQ
tara:strand:+ start:502 stop:1143 length:642 start_codon:yes stop_codon:yes gene_type:complete